MIGIMSYQKSVLSVISTSEGEEDTGHSSTHVPSES
jgi:hypothetical protein